MKQSIIIVLVFSLLLVGCSSNQEAENKVVSTEQIQKSKQEATGLDLKEINKEVIIKLWEGVDPKVGKTLDQLIDKFQKRYPNIIVERTHMETEELRQNTQTAFMGGRGPTLTLSSFDHIRPFSIMGIAQPLEDLMSKEMKSMYIENALPSMSLNGHIYGVPDTMGNHLTLLYNKKLVDKAPETWEELISMAKGLTKDIDNDGEIDQYGLVYHLTDPSWWVAFHGGFGGWAFDEDNNPILDTQATKDALQFVHDLKFEHKIVPEQVDSHLMDSLFKEGKAAYIIDGDWSYKSYDEDKDIDLGIAPLPIFQKSSKYAQPMISGSGYIMISELSESEQIAALKFIKFMTSKEAQKVLVEKHKLLPTNKSIYNLPIIREDQILSGLAKQLRNSKAMPIIPEMKAVWDAIAPVLESVMAGDLNPAKGAAQMQEIVEKKISKTK